MNPETPNKTDAGNGSKSVCRIIDASRSPSPDPARSASAISAALMNVKIAWKYFVLGQHRSAKRGHATDWVEPPRLKGQLWFGSLLVADLHRMFPHQGTWFSEYDLRITKDQGELRHQLLAYVNFCEDFNCRITEGRDHDFAEFDRFTPIPNCESWRAQLPNGCLVPMEGRMWFADGDASWQHPETEPSTEVAANEFWRQNTPNT